nr:hypothetical protein [Tanacetum cinerariifolium]
MMSLSKKKEKVTVDKRKGIDLLFEVALTKEAQYEEVCKKSLREFHKTHPSGSGIVTKIAPSAAKIKPDEDDNNNDHDSSSKGNDQEIDSGDNNTQSDNAKGSDSEHETDKNEMGSKSDQEENEKEVEDDDEEKDDKFFDDNVVVKLNELVNTDEGFIQKEGIDAEMINVQQGNENLEITLNHVIEDAHVTISTAKKKTEVLVTPTPPPTTEATNPLSALPNFASIFQFNNKVSVLKKEVDELKKDDLLITQVTALVNEHLDLRLGATKDEFMSYLLTSITVRIIEQNVGKTPQQGPTQSWLMTLAATADKPLKTFDELMSTPIDFSSYIMNILKITNLTQETLLGLAFKLLKGTRTNFAKLEYDFEECYKALSEKLDWDNPKGGDYPFYLSKPLPLVMNRNRQIVPVDYFFNDDLKCIKDMVLNIWSPVKVSYDKHALWGISHWREQLTRVEVMQKHGYGYLREIEFTRSTVIQKRVEDLQLGIESYQKKINITKPKTTRPDIKKKEPYTSYQDLQGFIYVDN